jgi:hypothetical protein
VIGAWFAGRLVEIHTGGGGVDWRAVWLVPAVGTLAATCLFAAFFHGHNRDHRGGGGGTQRRQ